VQACGIVSVTLRRLRSRFQDWPERLAFSHRRACKAAVEALVRERTVCLLCGAAGIGKTLAMRAILIELTARGFAIVHLDAAREPIDPLDAEIQARRSACGAGASLAVLIDHVEAIGRDGLKTLERVVTSALERDRRLRFLLAGLPECWTWIGILGLETLQGGVIIGLQPLPPDEAARHFARVWGDLGLAEPPPAAAAQRALRFAQCNPRAIDNAAVALLRSRRWTERLRDSISSEIERCFTPFLLVTVALTVSVAALALGAAAWHGLRSAGGPPPLLEVTLAPEPPIALLVLTAASAPSDAFTTISIPAPAMRAWSTRRTRAIRNLSYFVLAARAFQRRFGILLREEEVLRFRTERAELERPAADRATHLPVLPPSLPWLRHDGVVSQNAGAHEVDSYMLALTEPAAFSRKSATDLIGEAIALAALRWPPGGHGTQHALPTSVAAPARGKTSHGADFARGKTSRIIAAPPMVLSAATGDSLRSLYVRVYRGFSAPPFSVVRAANGATIKPGDLVVFPAPPHGWRRP
jgi:hypothetical protein